LGQVAHNPARAAFHAGQLARWVDRPDWENILDAYARCVRITRSQTQTYTLRPELFKEPAEKALHEAYQAAAGKLGSNPDVDQFLAAFEPMVPAISTFFGTAAEGGVLVMHEDMSIRENRLALLQHIVGMADGVADFSQLEGF
jgi:glycyl-tRNA synthetase